MNIVLPDSKKTQSSFYCLESRMFLKDSQGSLLVNSRLRRSEKEYTMQIGQCWAMPISESPDRLCRHPNSTECSRVLQRHASLRCIAAELKARRYIEATALYREKQ
jgi:hypothetical protein